MELNIEGEDWGQKPEGEGASLFNSRRRLIVCVVVFLLSGFVTLYVIKLNRKYYALLLMSLSPEELRLKWVSADNPKDKDFVICGLSDPDDKVRAAAALNLQNEKDPVVAKLLLELLDDPNDDVTANACTSIERFRGEAIIKELTKGLESPLEEKRSRCAFYLQEYEELAKDAVPIILKRLRMGESEDVKSEFIVLLRATKVRNSEVVEALTFLVKDRENSQSILNIAAKLLVECQSLRAEDVFIAELKEKSQGFRLKVLKMIWYSQFVSNRMKRELKNVLETGDVNEIIWSLIIFERFIPKQADIVELVVKLGNGSNGEIREYALKTLKKIPRR